MREPDHSTCYQDNRTENLDEEMNSLKIGKFVIVSVYADTEKQAGVSPVDNFVVPKLVSRSASIRVWMRPRTSYLDKVGLILLVSGGDYPVHFPT